MRTPIVLEPYEDSWPHDDPDADFRRVVAEYSRLDPLPTLTAPRAAECPRCESQDVAGLGPRRPRRAVRLALHERCNASGAMTDSGGMACVDSCH